VADVLDVTRRRVPNAILPVVNAAICQLTLVMTKTCFAGMLNDVVVPSGATCVSNATAVGWPVMGQAAPDV
jgi:hypothetical protein